MADCLCVGRVCRIRKSFCIFTHGEDTDKRTLLQKCRPSFIPNERMRIATQSAQRNTQYEKKRNNQQQQQHSQRVLAEQKKKLLQKIETNYHTLWLWF